jgi:putative endonuclease
LRGDKKYAVHIVASKSRTLYTGMTGFLETRILQHKRREIDGFTKRYNIDRLVWFHEFKYVRDAIARETEIKKWRREKRVGLIEEFNPSWEDLAADWGKPIKQIPRYARNDNPEGVG